MRKPLTREEAIAIYRAGEEVVVGVLLELDARMGKLSPSCMTSMSPSITTGPNAISE